MELRVLEHILLYDWHAEPDFWVRELPAVGRVTRDLGEGRYLDGCYSLLVELLIG